MTITDHASETRDPGLATGIIDVDIHPVPDYDLIMSYLPKQWRDHIAEYGIRTTNGLADLSDYPMLFGGGARADAWPDSGPPGSDLGLIRKQLLDMYDVKLGVLQCLSAGGRTLNPPSQALNPDLGHALTRATNDWQLEHLVEPEPRLRVAMAVPYESPDLAVAEIRRIGAHAGVVSLLMLSKTAEPLGAKKYWPIYAAAVEYGLPIQVHLSQGGGHPNTGTGWGSFHTEYHVGHTQSFQSQFVSLLLSGVFEEFPELKFVFVEGNVCHFVPLLNRLDYHWKNLRSEVPAIKRPPSEYVRDHFWLSTQPLDEPDKPVHLLEMFGEFGIDNILFSSDYPHFDFDDPFTAFPRIVGADLRQKILHDNAAKLFGVETN